MVEFKNPTAFFCLLLLPLLFFLRHVRVFMRLSYLAVLGDWQGDSFEWKGTAFTFLFRLYKLLELLAFIAVVVAYANPVMRHQEKVYISRGADVIFVVDSSPSMAAKDIAGISRLEAAKRSILTLAAENGGCSLGLVSMAKEAVLLVPPTMDRDFFMGRLDTLAVGELGDGTAIGTGLSTAVYHLEGSTAPKKAIVLITDGENNAGSINPYTASRLVEEKGISLYVLGLGTSGAVALEYTDPKTGRFYSGYFQSGYDSQTLSKLAAAGGGSFFNVENMDALKLAFSSINKTASLVQSYRIRSYDTDYYESCLLVAGLLVLAALVIKRLLLKEAL